jgi:5-methylcytosine-specific restriction endonuclease McrA
MAPDAIDREEKMAKYRHSFHRRARWRLVTRLMARDGENCTICGDLLDRHLRDFNGPLYITFDHILPRSHGGTTTFQNLRLAHSRCNSLRGNDPIAVDVEGAEAIEAA